MRYLALACLLTGCTTYGPLYPPPDSRALLDELIASTVRILVNCEDGSKGWGSGVVLESDGGNRIIATAAHVVNKDACTWTADDGSVLYVADMDTAHDVAILYGLGFTSNKLRLSREYVGMDVITIGYPHQPTSGTWSLQVTKGTLSAYVKDKYKISTPIYFGSSGGPVFDEYGDLVGLAVSIYVKDGIPFPGEAFATPAEVVFQMAKRASASIYAADEE